MPKTLKTRPRSLRTRDDDSADEPYSDELEGSSPSLMIDGFDAESMRSSGGAESEGDNDASDLTDSDGDDSDVSDEAALDVQAQLNKVSFGDLSKAQSRLSKDSPASRKRQRGAETSADTEAKLQALRDRLRELREAKGIPSMDSQAGRGKATARLQREDESDLEDTSDSDSEGSDVDGATSKKRSKHAPMAAPSNRAVSRKRTVVSSTQPASARARDPRFAPLSGPAPSREQVAKNYAFLDEYRQSEIAALKERLGEDGKGKKKAAAQASKKTKKGEKLSEEERARLKRELTRMESQEQSRRERQRLDEVARRHKKTEQEQVAQGKNPYFLKKSEQKRLALVDKFEGMKSKQKERALERRRKKVSAREKRNMPAARRDADG